MWFTPLLSGDEFAATSDESALSLSAVLVVSTGIASEGDTAYPLAFAGGIGLASESDSALALSASHAVNTGISSDTSSAQPLAPLFVLAPGLALEIDTAFSAPDFVAIETDEAIALVPHYLFARLSYARRQRAGMAGTRPAQLSTRLRK